MSAAARSSCPPAAEGGLTLPGVEPPLGAAGLNAPGTGGLPPPPAPGLDPGLGGTIGLGLVAGGGPRLPMPLDGRLEPGVDCGEGPPDLPGGEPPFMAPARPLSIAARASAATEPRAAFAFGAA